MSDLCLWSPAAPASSARTWWTAWCAAGQPVRVLDDFSTGLQDNLAHHAGRVEVVEGSITDPATVAKAVRGAGTVFHLGALASVARSVETPLVSHAACATGTLHRSRRGPQGGRQAGRVRGQLQRLRRATRRRTGRRRTCSPNALSPYAAAKLAGEYYMQAFAATYGIETVRLRFFNIFGPRQRADSPVLRRHRHLHRCSCSRGRPRRSTATACNRATSPTSPTACRRS